MLIIAIILFLIAAGFGLVVLVSILQDKSTPKAFVFTHGAFAVTALLIVIYYTLMHLNSAPTVSLIIFVIAALGGLTLFVLDMMGKKLPKSLALLHPIIAVIAVLTLAIFVLTHI